MKHLFLSASVAAVICIALLAIGACLFTPIAKHDASNPTSWRLSPSHHQMVSAVINQSISPDGRSWMIQLTDWELGPALPKGTRLLCRQNDLRQLNIIQCSGAVFLDGSHSQIMRENGVDLPEGIIFQTNNNFTASKLKPDMSINILLRTEWVVAPPFPPLSENISPNEDASPSSSTQD